MSSILGIDYGRRHVGLAIADEAVRQALPWKSLEVKTSADFIQQLKLVIKTESISKIVLGRPVKMTGEETILTAEVEAVAKELEVGLGVPIILVDERLTSKGQQVTSRNFQIDDHQLAARQLLEDYLLKH
ncbi:MAG: Holliday junction resolvase RuvX [Candidatus Komeilibacteria bacterium]|nr:Holliday junction resolvase RuvX [Candidatus Komeilibacteria bacterium]